MASSVTGSFFEAAARTTGNSGGGGGAGAVAGAAAGAGDAADRADGAFVLPGSSSTEKMLGAGCEAGGAAGGSGATIGAGVGAGAGGFSIASIRFTAITIPTNTTMNTSPSAAAQAVQGARV